MGKQTACRYNGMPFFLRRIKRKGLKNKMN
jgi:hypothetical protein